MNAGKIVVITGVTQGLGRAMVDRFDKLGWIVYGCGRSQVKVEELPYCASKFAIEGLTQSMAQELPNTVAVVALDPGGGIQTSMLAACGPQYMAYSPTPEAWSRVAVPYMLQLTTKDNGRSLTCPSAG